MSTYFSANLLQFFRLLSTIKRISIVVWKQHPKTRSRQKQKSPTLVSVGLFNRSVELFNVFVKFLKLSFSTCLIGVKPGSEVVLSAVNYMSIGGEEQL